MKVTFFSNFTSVVCGCLGAVLHIFLALYRTKCPGDQILIGHHVLIMQKQ